MVVAVAVFVLVVVVVVANAVGVGADVDAIVEGLKRFRCLYHSSNAFAWFFERQSNLEHCLSV